MSKVILVIEDNRDIRENTAEILQLAGYPVLTAENGKKGLETALREMPDLIVCDIMMPELDGYGLLHMLRKNPDTGDIPFIFLTARTERTDFRKGMEMGADDYLTKPFEDIELLNAVEARLKKSTLLHSSYPDSLEGLGRFLSEVKGDKFLKNLDGKYETIHLDKKQVLYQESRKPRFLYYLVQGKVKCFREHEDGKEYITHLYTKGDFIGYGAILEDAVYSDSAIVLENAEILQIPRGDFFLLLNGEISIATRFIRILARNGKEQEDRLLALAYSSLRKRVAEAILNLAAKFSDAGKDTLIEVSREELAQYVGTATESLIRTLGDFKAEKKIEIINGRILVRDPEKLKALSF